MTRTATCPSNWALERYLLGELPGSPSSVAEHIGACNACQATIAAKEADDIAFMSSPGAVETRRLLSRHEAGPKPRSADRTRSLWVRRNVAGVGAAAVMVIALALAVAMGDFARLAKGANVRDEEQVVLRFQREWMTAVRDKDAVALDRILADDYTYTDNRGTVSTKADSLRQARTAKDGLTSFQTSDAKARVYGDVAVVTGTIRVEGVSGGKTYETEVRFTDTLARLDGRWRAVAAHVSRPVASKPDER